MCSQEKDFRARGTILINLHMLANWKHFFWVVEHILNTQCENGMGWDGAKFTVKNWPKFNKISDFRQSVQLRRKVAEIPLEKLKICRQRWRAGSSPAFGTIVKSRLPTISSEAFFSKSAVNWLLFDYSQFFTTLSFSQFYILFTSGDFKKSCYFFGLSRWFLGSSVSSKQT